MWMERLWQILWQCQIFVHLTILQNIIFKNRVWRYQRGYQNPYIEDEQKTQWPKEKCKRTNNDLQNMHIKLKTRLKTGGQIRCSGRIGSSCFTSGTRRVNLVTIPVISHECGKDREVFTTSGTFTFMNKITLSNSSLMK